MIYRRAHQGTSSRGQGAERCTHRRCGAGWRGGPGRPQSQAKGETRADQAMIIKKTGNLNSCKKGEAIQSDEGILKAGAKCAFDVHDDGFCERICGACIAIELKKPKKECGSFLRPSTMSDKCPRCGTENLEAFRKPNSGLALFCPECTWV